MDFGEIFSNALKYPTLDYQKLLIVGAVYILTILTVLFLQFGIYNGTLSLVFGIISLLVNILLLGYGLSVLRHGIELDDVIPDFDWVTNFIDGIKYIVVTFVYLIVPTVVTFIVGIALGAGPLVTIFSKQTMDSLTNANTSSQVTQAFSSVPQEAWTGLITAISITTAVAIILFVIFGIFLEIGICRLAKYGSFGEAFRFGQILDDLKQIGIVKILLFFIVLSILASIIGFVIGFISLIPFIGVIVGSLVGRSFLLLFSNRAVGLLYSEV